jgi:hypothetical protein
MPSFPSFLKRAQKREWIGGRYTFPAEIREGKEVFRPECIIWFEMPDGLLVSSTVIDPRHPVTLAETLSEAMLRPEVGPPRRPARIRVPDEAMANELRMQIHGIPIAVAPVPELDATFAELCATAEKESNPTYLDDGATSPAIVARLFAVASRLFHAAPWHRASERQIIGVDIPAFDIHGACLSIIGAAGESLGLLLFRSIADFMAFAARLVRESDTDADDEIALRSLSFDRKKDLPPSLMREIREHRWPIAGNRAYPTVICLDDERTPIQATEHDFRIMTACTQAFLSFFERHDDVFDTDEPEPAADVFTTDDEITVVLTAPPHGLDTLVDDSLLDDEDDLVFDDEFFEPVPIEILPVVGRNDPCPCGSGKKYKKCHLGANQG